MDIHLAGQVMFFHMLCSVFNLTRRTSDITPIIPLLITIMTPAPDSGFDESTFSVASDVLQEIMTRSSLAGGAGTSTLTEPLLVWLNAHGDRGEPRLLRMFTRCDYSPLSDIQLVQSMVCLIHFVSCWSPWETTPPCISPPTSHR